MINPKVFEQIAHYSNQFEKNGWVTIPNFWQLEFAESVLKRLQHEKNWDIATLRDGKPFVAGLNEFHAQTPQFKGAFLNEILQYANKNEFQYLYEFLRIAGADTKPLRGYDDVKQLLNDNQYKQTLCQLTSLKHTTGLDGQFTKYAAGYFLKQHCDTRQYDTQQRHAAFLVNLSKDWQPDYGGLLHLQSPQGHIIETLVPQFNTLTILSIPHEHFVSQVASFVTQTRYCLTGWLWKDRES